MTIRCHPSSARTAQALRSSLPLKMWAHLCRRMPCLPRPRGAGASGCWNATLRRQEEWSGHDPVQDACAGEINDGARPVANKGARPELVNADVRCICTKMLVGEFWSIIKTPRADWQEIGRPRRRTRKNQGPC